MVQDWERNRGWWEMKGGVESPGSVINVPPWDSLGQGWQQALGKQIGTQDFGTNHYHL